MDTVVVVNAPVGPSDPQNGDEESRSLYEIRHGVYSEEVVQWLSLGTFQFPGWFWMTAFYVMAIMDVIMIPMSVYAGFWPVSSNIDGTIQTARYYARHNSTGDALMNDGLGRRIIVSGGDGVLMPVKSDLHDGVHFALDGAHLSVFYENTVIRFAMFWMTLSCYTMVLHHFCVADFVHGLELQVRGMMQWAWGLHTLCLYAMAVSFGSCGISSDSLAVFWHLMCILGLFSFVVLKNRLHVVRLAGYLLLGWSMITFHFTALAVGQTGYLCGTVVQYALAGFLSCRSYLPMWAVDGFKVAGDILLLLYVNSRESP